MSADISGMIERRRRLLGSAYRLFYEQPVHLVRGEGVWLYDADGNKYLDMYNNVPHVGHCHPKVVEAIARQSATLNTHTRYLHDNVIELAERLSARFPDELDKVMFSCTGSEANELALRIARTVTGGAGIVVTDFAYHGNTQAIFEISTEDVPPEAIPDYVVTVPSPDTYRDGYGEHEYADHVRNAIETLRRRDIQPAADLAANTVNGLRDQGILTGSIGRHDNILKLRPPMVCSRENADLFLGVLDDVLGGVARQASSRSQNA